MVDTWRENYPYDERMARPDYEDQKHSLQVETANTLHHPAR